MFGIKLRSWMEAVRPKKKQHRKEKHGKTNVTPATKNTIKDRTEKKLCSDYKVNNCYSSRINCFLTFICFKDPKCGVAGNSDAQSNGQSGSRVTCSGHSRFSTNNLSSPESAYSTGYSTDGTSPGAPPEYLINTYKHNEHCHKPEPLLNHVQIPITNRNLNGPLTTTTKVLPPSSPIVQNVAGYRTPILKNATPARELKFIPSQNVEVFPGPGSPGLGITSPRQRNRIRTNPWVPGSIPSPSPIKHNCSRESITKNPIKDNLKLHSPMSARCRSLSTSTCSSLSGTSLHVDGPSLSDEDDCTLNEMMGKYDESYVYEKETDILSDSDPTDCETDIDTGQDGGDEDDLYDGEFDFIDNNSYPEFDPRPDRNTGHCSYYNTHDIQRKRSSRRRTIRRSNKQSNEKIRKSSLNKKRQLKPQFEKEREVIVTYLDGSRSAGATPLSVRRACHSHVSRSTLNENLKKRSNSVSFYRDQRSNSVNFYRDHLSSIDRRDKEADLKYRELIFEADKLLRTMKINGLSPKRLPGPANKRVELLRNTECPKPDMFIKNKSGINEDNIYSKIPSCSYNSPRFSPKKSHITNFIINNSPVPVKKEWEIENQPFKSPLYNRKGNDVNPYTQNGILHKEVRSSPKHRSIVSRFHTIDSSSDSDDAARKPRNSFVGCPQSEPVRRKVYFANSPKLQRNGKCVVFKLTQEIKENRQNNMEHLKQQVLLNTIVNLKKKS
ncbi:hypothetical protein NQ317_018715 [Molorchus minor]|uniref:Uncharacterized protein n=1 Tax=Molorchus minor TaxID=1323400 RepID=A0ABQ9JSM6_9CUCU|nr:hypothetical protein NQ317_018715 [Molorchus minor]